MSDEVKKEAPAPEGGEVRAWMFRESPSERWHVTMDRRDADEYLKAFSTAEAHPLAIATREDAQPVAWRWKTPIQHVGDGTRWGWTFASHPSTPPASINPEPLFTHPYPDALREFGRHRSLELSYRYADEDDDGAWLVHRVNGGRNDREWTQIGSGETPETAIDEALAVLQAEQDSKS